MERLLSLFIFGVLIRFLIRTIRNIGKFLPKSGKRVYCYGCGVKLPRHELKLELKSRKDPNPTHPEPIYSGMPRTRDSAYERYLEAIDNGDITILQFCTKCGTPTPVIYISKFNLTGSWAIIPFIFIASMILLWSNCVVIVAQSREPNIVDLTIPMGIWFFVAGVPATILGVTWAAGLRHSKLFILGLLPVLLVNATCSGILFIADYPFEKENVESAVREFIADETTTEFADCCNQYQISQKSYAKISQKYFPQSKIRSVVSAICDRGEYIMVQRNFQTGAQTNLLRIFSGQQDDSVLISRQIDRDHKNLVRIPLKRVGFNDIMECTAQEVTYNLKVVVDGLSFTDQINAPDGDNWMWEGTDILVNALFFISEDETPDIKAKNMKVRPQRGDEITGHTLRRWNVQFRYLYLPRY